MRPLSIPRYVNKLILYADVWQIDEFRQLVHISTRAERMSTRQLFDNWLIIPLVSFFKQNWQILSVCIILNVMICCLGFGFLIENFPRPYALKKLNGQVSLFAGISETKSLNNEQRVLIVQSNYGITLNPRSLTHLTFFSHFLFELHPYLCIFADFLSDEFLLWRR